MSDVSDGDRAVAKYVAHVFGGKPSVKRYWDDDRRSSVDILKAEDSPDVGVASFATVGLSNCPLLRDGKEYPARVELVGACGTHTDSYPNILATAAFCVMNSHWFCYPGAIFPDIVSMYEESETMQHVFFTTPFIWEEELKTMELADRKVAWLQVVPISEAEMRIAEKEGPDALEDLFVEHQIDVYDLDRPSIA